MASSTLTETYIRNCYTRLHQKHVNLVDVYNDLLRKHDPNCSSVDITQNNYDHHQSNDININKLDESTDLTIPTDNLDIAAVPNSSKEKDQHVHTNLFFLKNPEDFRSNNLVRFCFSTMTLAEQYMADSYERLTRKHVQLLNLYNDLLRKHDPDHYYIFDIDKEHNNHQSDDVSVYAVVQTANAAIPINMPTVTYHQSDDVSVYGVAQTANDAIPINMPTVTYLSQDEQRITNNIIFIRNVEGLTIDQLHTLFDLYGHVEKIKIIGKTGHIMFRTVQDAQNAASKLQNLTVFNTKLVIEQSKFTYLSVTTEDMAKQKGKKCTNKFTANRMIRLSPTHTLMNYPDEAFFQEFERRGFHLISRRMVEQPKYDRKVAFLSFQTISIALNAFVTMQDQETDWGVRMRCKFARDA